MQIRSDQVFHYINTADPSNYDMTRFIYALNKYDPAINMGFCKAFRGLPIQNCLTDPSRRGWRFAGQFLPSSV
jgi:hypothetical protein